MLPPPSVVSYLELDAAVDLQDMSSHDYNRVTTLEFLRLFSRIFEGSVWGGNRKEGRTNKHTQNSSFDALVMKPSLVAQFYQERRNMKQCMCHE